MRRLIAAGLFIALGCGGAAAQPVPPAPAAAPAPPAVPATLVRVVLTTSAGAITIELDRGRAPITAGNFLRYVDQKRFDGVTFYRASNPPGFPDQGFIQGGTTDPKRVLPPIKHEPTTLTGLRHVAGALSAPRWEPGTARGDFTILLSDAPSLDADPKAPGDNLGYAVFGRVVEGMDVVRKIHAMPRATAKGQGVMKDEMLSAPVKILTARRSK